MQILISIKPKYVKQILDGSKTVEFRKTPIRRKVQKMQIYMSRTVKKVVAVAEIIEIVEDTPENLWSAFRHVAGISKTDFFNYFLDKNVGFALQLKNVRRLSEKEQYVPAHVPQSFCYIK